MALNGSGQLHTLLFMPCDPPPPLAQVIASALRNPLWNPALGHGFVAFQHSFVMLLLIGYVIWRGSYLVGYTISEAFGVSPAWSAIACFVLLVEIYRRASFQCTLWAWMVMYTIILEVIPLLTWASKTKAGKVVGLHKLPLAKRNDPKRNCLRLAACRRSIVFKHHEDAQARASMCERCLAQNRDFTSVFKNGNFSGYACKTTKPPSVRCPGDAICPKTRDALTVMGERSANAAAVCRESGGKLCFVAKAGKTYYGYAGTVAFDATSSGLGYPTKALCQKHRGKNADCVVLPGCKPTDSVASRNCYCNQFADVPRAADPCTFLQTKCDMKSPLYKLAQLQLAKRNIKPTDIVNTSDINKLSSSLDKALGYS